MTTLYVDNIAPNLQSKISAPNLTLPSGSVIQVVQNTLTNTQETTTSTSFTDTTLSASITPSSTSSKILISVSSQWHTLASTKFVAFALKRNTTDIAPGINHAGQTTTWGTVSFSYLDSPSSTDAVTYTLRFASYDGSTVVHGWGDGGVGSTQNIVLMEIAG